MIAKKSKIYKKFKHFSLFSMMLINGILRGKNKIKEVRVLTIFLILLVVVLVVLGLLSPSFLQSIGRPSNISNIKTPLPVIYDDEPELENNNFKISSSSAWIKPVDPAPIKKEYSLFMIGIYGPSDAEIARGWPFAPEHKEQLDSVGLEKKYYDFFFYTRQVPHLAFEADISEDGIKDKAFTSIGAGCGSCHEQYIDLFVGDDIYSTSANEAYIYPREDGKGFYMTIENPGKDGYCCPESITISRFEWNLTGFIETERKIVWISNK